MKEILILLILLIFAVSADGATIYKWVDKDGVVNFTDDLSKVPPSYQDRVEVETRKDVPEQSAPLSTEAIPQNSTEDKMITDNYGRGEAWWRDKVRPWKEKLKEATEKYESAEKKYTEKSDELSRRRSGSPTQYKMNIIELNKIREEKEKYQAQIAEANEMLGKLKKEAEETKADPAWLE
jgi:hypothetical protein